MDTSQDIAQQIGRKEISEALGVGIKAISNACVAGSFPASWYAEIKALCDERGIDCPLCAFNFKTPSPKAS
ncbi:MAG: hypothetical protein Unbinned5081contig1001_31 [Prokaryotic dsDNA virus sp.]|nr:MAG: hypothetical protein Unbinned5081contig1001_31 [Prokaryotic dsDNA virus sp.]